MESERTWVLEERVACHVRVNAYKAGTYMRASSTITLERMNNIFPGVSIPREVSKANHDGSIHDPLEANQIRQIMQRGYSVPYILPHIQET